MVELVAACICNDKKTSKRYRKDSKMVARCLRLGLSTLSFQREENSVLKHHLM